MRPCTLIVQVSRPRVAGLKSKKWPANMFASRNHKAAWRKVLQPPWRLTSQTAKRCAPLLVDACGMTSASAVYRGLPERFVAPKSGRPSRCRGGGKMICEVEIFWAFALVRRTSKKLCGRRIMFALSCLFCYFVEFNLICVV